MTQSTTAVDNTARGAAPAPADAAPDTNVADAAPAAGGSFPGSEALRDYGQRLTEALLAKGQELTEPANRRAMWPVLVATVAGLVVARDVLFTSAGPATAAAYVATGEAGGGGRAGASGNLVAPAPAAQAATPLRAWLDEPLVPVDRNIFTSGQPAAVAGPESAAPHAKSPAGSADSNLRREGATPASPVVSVAPETAAASGKSGSQKMQARQIRLQSTLMGATPTALVNGQMVREGDVVASGTGATRAAYRVLKIEARRIILEREGIRSEIPLD